MLRRLTFRAPFDRLFRLSPPTRQTAYTFHAIRPLDGWRLHGSL
jgi:hypothetical protein